MRGFFARRRAQKLGVLTAFVVLAAIAAVSAYAYFSSAGATRSDPTAITSSTPAAGQLMANGPTYGGGSTTNLVLGGTQTWDLWVFNNTGQSITVSKVGLDPAFSSHGVSGVTGIPASCPADVSSWFSGPDVSFTAPTTLAANGNSGHVNFVLTLNNSGSAQDCLLGASLVTHLITK